MPETLTLEEVRRRLLAEEPDYTDLAELGPDILPYLERLIQGEDSLLAAKATYLATLIPDDHTPSILARAAEHPDPVIRTTAARATRNLPPQAASNILISLVQDEDLGTRRAALAAVTRNNNSYLRKAIEAVPAEDDSTTQGLRARALGECCAGGQTPTEAVAPGATGGGELPAARGIRRASAPSFGEPSPSAPSPVTPVHAMGQGGGDLGHTAAIAPSGGGELPAASRKRASKTKRPKAGRTPRKRSG